MTNPIPASELTPGMSRRLAKELKRWADNTEDNLGGLGLTYWETALLEAYRAEPSHDTAPLPDDALEPEHALTVVRMVRALRKVAQSNGPSIGQQSLMRRLADALEADDE